MIYNLLQDMKSETAKQTPLNETPWGFVNLQQNKQFKPTPKMKPLEVFKFSLNKTASNINISCKPPRQKPQKRSPVRLCITSQNKIPKYRSTLIQHIQPSGVI